MIGPLGLLTLPKSFPALSWICSVFPNWLCFACPNIVETADTDFTPEGDAKRPKTSPHNGASAVVPSYSLDHSNFCPLPNPLLLPLPPPPTTSLASHSRAAFSILPDHQSHLGIFIKNIHPQVPPLEILVWGPKILFLLHIRPSYTWANSLCGSVKCRNYFLNICQAQD